MDTDLRLRSTPASPLPGGGEGTDLYIKKSAFHDAFAGDLPLATTNLMWAEQRPFSVAALHRALRRPGLEDRSLVVPGVHERPRDPAGHTVVHGSARTRKHRNRQSLARADDLPS
jgi:hypothetical protein